MYSIFINKDNNMANNKTILDKIIEQAIMQPSAASKIAKSIFDMKTAANKADYISKTLMRITSSSMYKEVATEFKKLSSGQGIAQYVTSNVPKEFANVGIFNSIIKHLNSIQANPQSIQIFDTYTKQLVAKPFTKTDGSLMSLPTDVESAISKAISDPETLHNVLTVASIAVLVIPFIGPAVSAGISLGNAGLYAGEGKGYEAGLEATFALIPGLGKLAKMSGITQLGNEGMKKLAGKLIAIKAGKQITLDATEQLALKTIAANKQVVETEVKKSLAKRVATGTRKVATNVATDILAVEAYDKIYLKAAGTTLDDWLTKWWDDWLLNPVVESTNIYQDIANQIALNEQTSVADQLKTTKWNTRKGANPMPRSKNAEKTTDWMDDNPKTTLAILGGGTAIAGALVFALSRGAFRKIKNIKNWFSGGKLTTAGAQGIAGKLDEFGLKRLKDYLDQNIRSKLLKALSEGEITREQAYTELLKGGFVPKKYMNPLGYRRLMKALQKTEKAGKSAKDLADLIAKNKEAAAKPIVPTPKTPYGPGHPLWVDPLTIIPKP